MTGIGHLSLSLSLPLLPFPLSAVRYGIRRKARSRGRPYPADSVDQKSSCKSRRTGRTREREEEKERRASELRSSVTGTVVAQTHQHAPISVGWCTHERVCVHSHSGNSREHTITISPAFLPAPRNIPLHRACFTFSFSSSSVVVSGTSFTPALAALCPLTFPAEKKPPTESTLLTGSRLPKIFPRRIIRSMSSLLALLSLALTASPVAHEF